MDFKAVPANLQRMMRLLDVSPKHLAASIGMSERSLYRKFKNPSKFTLGELDTISRKYKISLGKMLESM
ncbi:MAG: helix-turn-helix domain-containing protein [Bacteroidales bacterium]|nr:helix-turn-helix domain-containing protein [Bacteroidales bacterium]